MSARKAAVAVQKHNATPDAPDAVVKKRGKRYASAIAGLDRAVEHPLKDAIGLLQALPKKFDETLEVVFVLGVDPRHSDQFVRGAETLPHGTGKKIRVAVIANESKWAEAKAAGADVVGGEDLIDTIKSGVIEFDRCIATPDMMGKIGVIARVLGPKGLMPNPKLGTVTADVAAAVKAAKSGVVEYRVDKNGIIHAGVGKFSFSAEHLYENAVALVKAVLKAKPQAAKGTYMKAAYVSSTMGPSLKVAVSSLYV